MAQTYDQVKDRAKTVEERLEQLEDKENNNKGGLSDKEKEELAALKEEEQSFLNTGKGRRALLRTGRGRTALAETAEGRVMLLRTHEGREVLRTRRRDDPAIVGTDKDVLEIRHNPEGRQVLALTPEFGMTVIGPDIYGDVMAWPTRANAPYWLQDQFNPARHDDEA